MNIFPLFFAAAKIGIGRGSFYFATTKIRIGRGPFYFAATKIGIGRVIVATTSFRRRAILLAGTIALHRFSISGPDLRIDAARRSKQGQSVHRFSISSPDLRIDAAKRSKQEQSLQPKG